MTLRQAATTARFPAAKFAEIATSELGAFRSFVALLEQEQAALKETGTDALPKITAAKSELLHVLTRCAEERRRVFDEAGVPADADQVKRLLAGEPRAQETWDEVIVTARRAAELNTANGFVTNQRLAHVGRALTLLAGFSPSLYDTRGSASLGVSASRSLGSV